MSAACSRAPRQDARTSSMTPRCPSRSLSPPDRKERKMSEDVRAAAIRLYDRFTHEGLDRRAFMAELTRISGSAAAANALLLGIAASPAAAAIVPENDDRLIIRRGSLGLKGRALNGYVDRKSTRLNSST